MRCAVVILNWNGRKMLEKYLPNVIECSSEVADVIIADNASTDDSLVWLREHHPDVRTVVLDRNYGFAEGYNRALKMLEETDSTYDYYVLLNSDVEVTSHWLSPLMEYMDSHDDVAACQPKLLALLDKGSFEYAGASGGYIDKYGYPFCRGRLFETVEQDSGQYDSLADVLWATGACMLIRSKDYWNVGGLDGRFFAHNEEIDLCWRLRLMGRRIVCVPQSKVYHLGGGTLPRGNSRKTYLNFRNNLTMLYKCLPDDELRHVMVVRWLLDYVAAWQTLLVNRNWGDFCAIYRARRDFRRLIPEYKSERQRLQCERTLLRVPERLPLSLLWQYYAKGRRTFSSLPLRKA